jgi:hypothetical protein
VHAQGVIWLTPYQDAAHQRYLQRGREYVKDHGRQQEADTFCTAVNGPCQATSLSRQMEVQVKFQQVLVHTAGDLANSLLCDTCKNGIAKLLGHGCANSSEAVCLV